MNTTKLHELLRDCPIVAAIKDDAGLENCLECECNIVFILYGNINTISEIVDRAKYNGKTVFVHIDLIDGLAAKESAVKYLADKTQADGIISTKAPLIRCARDYGLLTVQRFFVLDSLALKNIHKSDKANDSDLIEILPGVMPKIIGKLCKKLARPIIAGGLISDKEDVVAALSAGAVAVSTTSESVWRL